MSLCVVPLSSRPEASPPERELGLGRLVQHPPSVRQPRAALQWILPAPFMCHSWALSGGPSRVSQQIVWLQVSNEDLPPDRCPQAFIEQVLEERQWQQSVALMTSAQISEVTSWTVEDRGICASAVATVGLGNALRAGDASAWSPRVGTINIACALNIPLSPNATLEALSLMSEAKAAAVMDQRIFSRISGRLATGTGTDCHVLAFPPEPGGTAYTGKHTLCGSLIGEAVYQVVYQGCAIWKANFPQHIVLQEGSPCKL